MEYLLLALALSAALYFFVKKLKKIANDSLEKKIKLAEELTIKNDNFIQKKWHLDIDLSKTALDRWAQRVNKHIGLINNALIQLEPNQETWKEYSWIRDPDLKAARSNLTAKLLAQKKIIHSNFIELVESIPQKVDQLILKIKPDFRDSQQFMPSMEASQLEQLTDFVNKYGNEQTKNAFKQNTSLINLFSKALDSGELLTKQKNNENLIPTPWGGYHRLEASFEGWRHLMNGWMVKGAKKEALMSILSLLEGKTSLTPEKFEETLTLLEPESNKLKETIQSHLFLLLDSNAYLKLLKKGDQKRIKDWYETQKAEILRAKRLMEAILNDPSLPVPEPKVLEKYFYLLDQAVLICDIQSEYQFQNIVRQYFKNYEGDTPCAHLFLRFIPEGTQERCELTKEVLIKRLEWFIRIACSGIVFKSDTISQADISLFNDDRVNANRESVQLIDEKLKQHVFYQKPYQPAFDHFLSIWSAHGLCSEEVRSSYHVKARSVGETIGI